MELFGIDLMFLLGGFTLGLLVALVLLVLVGLLFAILFIRFHRIIIPRVTLVVMSMMEIPIRHLLWTFNVDTKRNDQDVLDLMIAKIRNELYRRQFAEVPMRKRAVFLPQCIRHKDCPARLGPEGIECISCGKCPAKDIKKEAQKLGYKFFIVPGGSFVRRMIAKHKPKAIIGIGCHNEIKEGTAMTSAFGIPSQGIPLIRDGCVGTDTDWDQVLQTMRMTARK